MTNIFDIQGWSVSVEVDAETILTIGHNSLSGIDDFTAAQAQVIRNCAEHLLAFIGSPCTATPSAPAVDALLYEHEDGRQAVALTVSQATFAHGDPAWHRVGPITVHGAALSASTEAAAGEPVAQWQAKLLDPTLPECATWIDISEEGAKTVAEKYSHVYMLRALYERTAPPADSGQKLISREWLEKQLAKGGEEPAGLMAINPDWLRPNGASGQKLTSAAHDVLAERERQKTIEGWTPEHDDEHDVGEMADAAAAYALHASGWTDAMPHEIWPADWSQKWWKPTTPRRDLIKAGALILAEIERLDRASDSATASDKESA